MTANINEAISKIKLVGRANTRIVKEDGNISTEKSRIEVKEQGTWVTVVSGVSFKMAEDIVSQASNNVILG